MSKPPDFRHSQRLTLKTTLLSVLAAVLVFAVATQFEDDARWRVPAPETPQMNPLQESGVRGPLQTSSAAENCQRAEQQIRRSVAQARSCTTDSDCTIFDFGYPIQCLTSVAKNEITALRLEFRQYQVSCEFRVYYDCPTGDSQRQPVCREQRCEVELTTHEELQEETLDFLGLGQ